MSAYRAKLALLLGDRSKYPGGYYPNEVEKGFGQGGRYPSAAEVQQWSHKADVLTAAGDEKVSSGAEPTVGEPFIVYRLESQGGGLEGRNAGNADGVSEHLARLDDVEKPGFVGGSGDHITAYRVVAHSPFEKYQASVRGRGVDNATAVGRQANPYRGGGGGRVTYSFPSGGGWSAEPVQSLPLTTFREALKAKGYADFDDVGTLNGGNMIREVFTRSASPELRADPIVNLPDVSDVSFPAIVGAIPSKPKKKKRRAVTYQGVRLARVPMAFEVKVLSLTEIPGRLDAATASVLGSGHYDATMREIGRYGAAQVLLELSRQGAPSALRWQDELEEAADLASTEACVRLHADLDREWATLRERGSLLLASRKLPDLRRSTLLQAFMDRWEPSVHKRYAGRAVNEAFALGRAVTMAAFRRPHVDAFHLISKAKYKKLEEGDLWVDAVVHTAVMDYGTCDPCSEVDGEVMDFGSDRQEELRPPYVNCLGSIYAPEAPRCRCVQIALLSDGSELDIDEVPAEADAFE